MAGQDDEIQFLKASVNCATVLERLPPVWRLDAVESTQKSLKYRRGAGEILIVNHDGRGWWDPLSEAKGDIFTLVQHLDPGLDFAAARCLLRGFAGIPPTFPIILRARRTRAALIPIAQRWARHPTLSCGSRTWLYLTGERGLPADVLLAARAVDAIREGPHDSAWFAHRDETGGVVGIEMRGSAWRNFSAGGEKTLFRLPGAPGSLPRVAVCEAAIDALSLAAIEGLSGDTLYAATTGGMGPATISALRRHLQVLSADPAGLLIAATDADVAGHRYAARLAGMAADANVRFARLVPADGLNDWNDALRALAPAS